MVEPAEVGERNWSMGELVAELPAVEGRLTLPARVMEGDVGSPMNIPEWRFDRGREASTGDPRY